MEKKIITRFAPSPTGELHVGNARSALFEYLFAKHADGSFLLRIEDTDRERYVEGSVDRIIESLSWLGIKADNENNIMVQSNRLEVYKKAAFDLVKAGKAYICTCSKEKLAESRSRQEKEGRPPRYEGFCRTSELSLADLKEGCYTVRLKMPETGNIVVHDMIRGDVEFDLSLFDDQVLLKSDGYPTYHLASVVDDHEMEINHVIRAEEWLPSTPKHLVLYEAFGWEAPTFAHLPMILAPDRTKLSKRHGATSVMEYKNLGYLPEALVNFMAFLGWNPGDEREIFSLEDLEQEFKIERVNKAPAVFNIEKLNHINQHYIKVRAEQGQLVSSLLDFGITEVSTGELELISRGGFNTLREMVDYLLEFRKEPEYPDEMLVFKKSDRETTLEALKLVSDKLISSKQWSSETIQQLLTEVVSEGGFTNGDVFWPARVALSGKEKSPSPVELMVALGKEQSLDRIKRAIAQLS